MLGLFEKGSTNEFGMTQEEVKTVGEIRSKVEEIRASANRVAHESIWMTNVAYSLGYDGVSFNSISRQFTPVNRGSSFVRRNRIHVNKILPTLQNRLAKLCKSPPKYDVRPESNDAEDRDAARLGLQTLDWMWDKLKLNEKRIPLYMWVQQTGHAYVKVCWDNAMGDPLPPEFGGGYSGDMRADVCSPFEIFPNPMAKSNEDLYSSWLIQAKVRPLDYFKMQYPERGQFVKQEQAWLMSLQYENRIQSLNPKGPAQGGMQDLMKDSAIEMIKYEARSPKYPNGRMVICANGVLLEEKELPCGIIPFAKFDDIVVGGKFYSESTVSHLRPLQDQYNEVIRRRAEWTKRLLAGKFQAPRGSNLKQESLNDESGEVLYYDIVPNAPAGIQPVAVPNIPSYAYNEEDRLIQMFNDMSGITEVSRGVIPSASIPAAGMAILQEADDSRIGIITENHEHAWARIGTLILKNVEHNYKLPRKMKLAGKSMQYAVKEISGDMLKGNTDVIVVRGSTLPGNKALKRQEIINAWQQGLLGDPASPDVRQKVLSQLEFGDIGETWKELGIQSNYLKREFEKMDQGQPHEAHEGDDHRLWIKEINDLRMSDKWSTIDDPIKQLYISAYDQHVEELMKLSGRLPEKPNLDPEVVAQEMGLDQPMGPTTPGAAPGAAAPVPMEGLPQ